MGKKYIATNYKVDPVKHSHFIKKALTNGVEKKILLQVKCVGASGSFKLAKVEKVKPKKKAVKPKKAKTPGKPKKKKATKPKPSKLLRRQKSPRSLLRNRLNLRNLWLKRHLRLQPRNRRRRQHLKRSKPVHTFAVMLNGPLSGPRQCLC